ncbi:MAG: hypothetical protein CMK59_02815 [Proteobacteria bacterium]|nr:hypothetical protein [Pseudomonadota bacterium]
MSNVYKKYRKMFDWPDDVRRFILGIALCQDIIPVIQQMKANLQPERKGEAIKKKGWRKMRDSSVLPTILRPFYEAYDDTVAFRYGGLVLLSESEMFPCTEWLDFAYRYEGMGHFMVHSYIKSKDIVVSCVDGGSNGYEQDENTRFRRESIEKFIREGEKGSALQIASLVEWWQSASLRETTSTHGPN